MRLADFLSRFAAAREGAAAVELALVGSLMIGALLNVAEVGRYAYTTTQVLAASQAGAQILLSNCQPNETPVTLLCPNAAGMVTSAVRSTSLGEDVTLQGPLSEAWYCVDKTGALKEVGPADNKPTDCAGAGDPTMTPGLYVRVRVAYDYAPLFPGLTLAETLPDVIVRTAWMRVR